MATTKADNVTVTLPRAEWNAMHDKAAAHGPMKEALGNLSRYVEREIAAGRWRWNGDWACAECHPDSEILKQGFACARHAALALAQKVTPCPGRGAAGPAPGVDTRCVTADDAEAPHE